MDLQVQQAGGGPVGCKDRDLRAAALGIISLVAHRMVPAHCAEESGVVVGDWLAGRRAVLGAGGVWTSSRNVSGKSCQRDDTGR